MTEQILPEDQSEAVAEVDKALVKADAKERSKRTFKQGLIFAVAAALASAALNVIGAWTHNDFISSSSWFILGTSLIQAGTMAGLAYIQRFTTAPEFSPTQE